MFTITEYNLKDISLFKNINKEAEKEIKTKAQIKKYNKDEVLFLKGDKAEVFYIVLNGEIKIIRSSRSGREKILKKMGEYDFFGEMGILENKTRSATSIATKDSTLLTFFYMDFLDFLNKYPQISLNIIVELSRRLRNADRDIENLSFLNVEAHLKKFILKKGKRINMDGREVFFLENAITHKEIAGYLGTSRETITRIINKLQKKGVIFYKDHKLYYNLDEKAK